MLLCKSVDRVNLAVPSRILAAPIDALRDDLLRLGVDEQCPERSRRVLPSNLNRSSHILLVHLAPHLMILDGNLGLARLASKEPIG